MNKQLTLVGRDAQTVQEVINTVRAKVPGLAGKSDTEVLSALIDAGLAQEGVII